MGPPSDQPIQSTVSLDRNEFLRILKDNEPASDRHTLDQQADRNIRNLASIISQTSSTSDIKLSCPWYGGPSIEVTLKIDVPLAFSEQLLRYSLAKGRASLG